MVGICLQYSINFADFLLHYDNRAQMYFDMSMNILFVLLGDDLTESQMQKIRSILFHIFYNLLVWSEYGFWLIQYTDAMLIKTNRNGLCGIIN